MKIDRNSARLAAAVVVLGASCPLALAQTFNFSGYGTLGFVRSDYDRADYQIDLFKPNGPGATREWSMDVDSRLGAQATAVFTPRLSAVVQVLAQQRYDDTYQPEIEWANVKYEAAPDLNVRVGRIVLPIFLVTDSRRVGYANVWVRPPVEVYSLVPVTSSDGADLSWRKSFGDFRNTFEMTVGRTSPRFPPSPTVGSGKAEARRLFAAVDSLEYGRATLKLSYGQADLTVAAFDPFFDAFRQFGPPGADIARRYELRDKRVDFVGVGGMYDPGNWFAIAEWAKFDTHSVIGARSAWFASAGYRFGRATVYATYARSRAESATSDPGLPVAALPPQVQPVAAGLNAALNAQLADIPRQRTLSAGVRWDVGRNVALKMQYDDVRPQEGSAGTFNNEQPGFVPGTRVRLFSATLDFVF